MFQCGKCKEFESKYDYRTKCFICGNCNRKRIAEPKKSKCSCGNIYDEYTWFDPSGCSECGQSFVD